MKCVRQKTAIIFVSEKFHEVGSENEKGEFGFGYGYKIMIEVGIYK